VRTSRAMGSMNAQKARKGKGEKGEAVGGRKSERKSETSAKRKIVGVKLKSISERGVPGFAVKCELRGHT